MSTRSTPLELFISASLALLLGLIFTALALANLFGQMLGPKGKIFIFEMDEVEQLLVIFFSYFWETFKVALFIGDGRVAGDSQLFKAGSSSSLPRSSWSISLLVF